MNTYLLVGFLMIATLKLFSKDFGFVFTGGNEAVGFNLFTIFIYIGAIYFVYLFAVKLKNKKK